MSRNLEDLHPDLRTIAIRLIGLASARGIPVVVTQTLRTLEEQAELYAKGRTVPGKIVTNAKPGESPHNFGLAFDVAFREGENGVTWEGPWTELGRIAAEIGLEWGGHWLSFPDRPHFQMPNWRQYIEAEPERPTIRWNDRDPAVIHLRRELDRLNYLSPPDEFDETLFYAVRHFQHENGLKVDGIVGPKTWAALETAKEFRP